jgi:hypothetical protein
MRSCLILTALVACWFASAQNQKGRWEAFGNMGIQSASLNYFTSMGYSFSKTEGYQLGIGAAYYLRDKKSEWHFALEGVYRRSPLTTSQFINPDLGYYMEDFGHPTGNYIEQFPGLQLTLGYGFYLTSPTHENAVGLRFGLTGFYKIRHQIVYYTDDEVRVKDFQTFLPGFRMEWPFFFKARRGYGKGFCITWLGDMFFTPNNNDFPGSSVTTNLAWAAALRLGYRF